MNAEINIVGEIGVDLNLIDVISQVKAQPNATSLTVNINSVGGVVDTGFEIYDYLKSLNLPITTVGSGIVASIATVIFMVGNSRILKNGTTFMIHLPSGSISGTAQEIEAYNKMVKDAEKKIIDFYVQNTNNSIEAIYPLLNNETYLTHEQALALGFTTSLPEPIQAKAYFNQNSNNMTNTDKSWLESQFQKILNLGKPVVNLVTKTDASGIIIEFPDLNEGDMPKPGDNATVSGQPANGVYLLPDGTSYTFLQGQLTEIIDPAGISQELEMLKAENEALKTELEAVNAKFVEQTNAVIELRKSITSKFEVTPVATPEPVANISDAQKRLEKLKNRK